MRLFEYHFKVYAHKQHVIRTHFVASDFFQTKASFELLEALINSFTGV